MKIDKKVYNYIEFELQHYEENKEKLKEMRADIIEASPKPSDGQPKGQGGTGKPTERKTVKLMTTIALIQLEKTITAIENVKDRLNDDYKKFFEFNYIKQAGIVKTCNEIPIGERTYYNMRDKIVYAVGQEMGLF